MLRVNDVVLEDDLDVVAVVFLQLIESRTDPLAERSSKFKRLDHGDLGVLVTQVGRPFDRYGVDVLRIWACTLRTRPFSTARSTSAWSPFELLLDAVQTLCDLIELLINRVVSRLTGHQPSSSKRRCDDTYSFHIEDDGHH